MSPAIGILGSARSDGHTAALLARLIAGFHCEVIDLNTVRIAGYRYDQQYQEDDDFLVIIDKVIASPITIFATPVYWYSCSWLMKTFIDRMSDLLSSRAETGRRLRGRSFALLTSGSDPDPDPDVVSAFTRLCAYMGVTFVGVVHGMEAGPLADQQAVARVQQLMRRA